MKYKILAYSLTLLLVGLAAHALSSNNEDICRVFPNQTKVRDPLSCKRYITCNGSVSEYSTCSTSTPYFDKNTGKCVKTLTDNSTCDLLSCQGRIEEFIGDPTSCKGYYYCADATSPIHGKCPDKTHFSAATQSCTYKEYSGCKLDKFDVCAIAKNGITVASENDCRKYFECKRNVLTTKECKAGTYYDAATGLCLHKWKVDCAKHPLPDNVCGTTKKPLINKFVSDGATCRGYYYCADKKGVPDPAPVWRQCHQNTFFDPNNESCGNPLDITCPLGADRCDGRTLTFVSSSEKGCRQYLRCNNGKTVQELSCGNRFFDENMVVCISAPITYKSCS
ncbi:peritrophin-44-like [Eurosta solidaginis]|uniref:peritrophin-44-like n=1 Tax=Eurosta solidaginis TaxID=178769 RepID=UPI003530C79B